MASKPKSVLSSNCSFCGEKFINIQDCFKHEIVKHSLQKKSSQQCRIQKRFNATAKFLNSEDKQMERKRLKVHLSKYKKDQELRAIFELFCMKADDLDLIYTRIRTCLEKELRSAGIVRIYAFGSIASGLALRDCDIDIFLDVSNVHTSPIHTKNIKINNKAIHQRKAFNRINSLLQRSPHFTDVYAIRSARVPIIKCKHEDTGFRIDINVSCPSSRANTQFIYDLVQSEARIHEMMLFLKLWAKNTQIIGKGNMTSYCLVTVVIFFLQQPRKSDSKANGNYRILKSIKELQQNRPFHMVEGVNYAYDLNSEGYRPEVPATITTWDLIKQFFEFYQNYDFENHIISPFYGESLAKTNLTPLTCEEYDKQLRTITQCMQGEEANKFEVDRSMCVQDAFCLNQNTAKNISFQNRQYIIFCLKNAHKICENPQKLPLAEIYEQLLFETININANNIKEDTRAKVILDLKNLKFPTVESTNERSLLYTILPSKADLRAVASHFPDKISTKEILQCWCQHYVEAIEMIMIKIYRMDMQRQLVTQTKQQKLDEEENGKELNKSWFICCTIDLWSNRCFQKNLKHTFMSYQLEQTEQLHALRRQDSKFAVSLNGILKLNILPNYMGIDVQLELVEGVSATCLNKKNPIRKFFNVLKNTLQSYNFKEITSIDDLHLNNSTNNNEIIAANL